MRPICILLFFFHSKKGKQFSHLLAEKSITGIKKSPEEYKIKGTDVRTDILLCVSNMCDDVKISMLSEESFEEVWFLYSSNIYGRECHCKI